MTQYTIVEGDIQYLGFYLKDKDPVTGTITAHTLATANSIIFKMWAYGDTIATITTLMSTVATPANTTGYCRVLVTIPAEGDYYSKITVYDGSEKITWLGHTYKVASQGVL